MLNITWVDYPDNLDEAVIFYFDGCSHGCKNCHNKDLQEYKGINTALDIYNFIKGALKAYRVNRVVLSGGDPLYIKNRNVTIDLLKMLAKDKIDVCLYTGYNMSEVMTLFNSKLQKDECPLYVKTGKYDESQKQLSDKTEEYMKLASKNQEIWKYINGKYETNTKDGIYYFNIKEQVNE